MTRAISSDNENNNESNNKSNNNADELDWQWPDDNEPDTSNPEYEVDEINATQKGAPYESDE